MGINVLSLFDGMSCGMIALEKTGIKVENYFASEIDKNAIQISSENYPKIKHLGDINEWKTWNLPKIDLIIGGSPCQGFSIAGKKLNFEDPRSKLVFVFKDILDFYKPKYFMLENVATMKNQIKEKIDELFKCEGIYINSNTASAQNRKRYYWTNIEFEINKNSSNLLIKDILEEKIDNVEKLLMKEEKYKNQIFNQTETDGVITLNPKRIDGKQTYQQDRIYDCNGKMPALTANLGNRFYIKDNNGLVRKLTVREQARLQNIPEKYKFDCLNDLNSSKAIGNGWTVDVIAHIFKGMA